MSSPKERIKPKLTFAAFDLAQEDVKKNTVLLAFVGRATRLFLKVTRQGRDFIAKNDCTT